MTTKPDIPNTKNALEWTVFALSSILVIAAFIFLIVMALQHDQRPADVRVAVGKVEIATSTIVTLETRNEGSQTASQVAIAVTATYPEGKKEFSVTLDFIPKKGTRKAFAVFDSTDKPLSVTAQVQGYTEP